MYRPKTSSSQDTKFEQKSAAHLKCSVFSVELCQRSWLGVEGFLSRWTSLKGFCSHASRVGLYYGTGIIGCSDCVCVCVDLRQLHLPPAIVIISVKPPVPFLGDLKC